MYKLKRTVKLELIILEPGRSKEKVSICSKYQ